MPEGRCSTGADETVEGAERIDAERGGRGSGLRDGSGISDIWQR